MNHDEIIEVLKAHRDGKEIEFFSCRKWVLPQPNPTTLKQILEWTSSQYRVVRVKPEEPPTREDL